MTQRTEDAIDAELQSLGRADLDPLAARSVRVAAERRLEAGRAGPSSLGRYEPRVLTALAVAQLAWAMARVLTLGH